MHFGDGFDDVVGFHAGDDILGALVMRRILLDDLARSAVVQVDTL